MNASFSSVVIIFCVYSVLLKLILMLLMHENKPVCCESKHLVGTCAGIYKSFTIQQQMYIEYNALKLVQNSSHYTLCKTGPSYVLQ